MKWRGGLILLAMLATVGCPRPATAPMPLPKAIRAIAVFPPNNRTGDDLLISGASFLDRYALQSERVTVPDALASEARLQLARRGFTIVAPEVVEAATGGHAPATPTEAAAIATRSHLDASVLYIEVRRWEADGPFKPTFIIASVGLSLIDPSSGRVVWQADHPSRPVPTNGVISVGDAYALAAHKLMEDLLAVLGPEQPEL